KSDGEVVEMMIGREYSHVFPPKPVRPASEAPAVIEVRNLCWADRLKDISLAARAGQVVGLGGLDGQGQREFPLALFGVLKVVIAKWLMVSPRIILLNDPTRGIDVGTKQEMYQLLRKLADSGAAIIFYSTDYDELIGCCDRVLVLYDGAVKRVLEGSEITER